MTPKLGFTDSLLLWERLGVQGHHDLVPRPTTEMHSQQRTRLNSAVLPSGGRKCSSVSLSLRWKRDASGGKVMQDGNPVLEFVAIKRKDTGDWALPGVSG